ncbi:MAG: putative baseplate assembly protein [Candidatus Thiodiazotropha sp. (ex Epidulcina cf. delphinae)]|nr:putative baseplate assembly protein [Candidatus Thiodiazotropha sp. (ex Epidulcina cf. delphinae)]
MSRPWWGRDRNPGSEPLLVDPGQGAPSMPILHQAYTGVLAEEVAERRPAFTPSWTAEGKEDAGEALVELFDMLGIPVLERLNRLPEKASVEILRTAGIEPRAARPAAAMLAFTASKGAPAAVTVGMGFQVTAPAADGSGDRVFFETEQTVYATAAEIEAVFTSTGRLAQEIDIDAESETGWQPFGPRPRVGSALLIGLTADAAIGSTLSLGIEPVAAEGTPPPASSGAVVGTALAQPLLRWEYYDAGAFERLEVIRDETQGLQQFGIVELAIPAAWQAGLLSDISVEEPLRWLRLRVVHGEFQRAPRLRLLGLNMTPAVALRTIRNEVLQFIPGSQRRKLRLSQRPIIDQTLELVVFDGVNNTRETIWRQVDDLNSAQADDPVYRLDPVKGEIETGDGVHGKLLPVGFRNVVARRYQIGGGAAGAVDAETITGLQQSAPFLTAVTNPRPASGGRDEATWLETLRTGPERIRARNRAVTTADYALLALDASGADVGRAHAVSALHPNFEGARIAGVVTLFIIASAKPDTMPVPDPDTLTNVASFLSAEVAPAGVQVVAAVPRFHTISVRAALVPLANANTGTVVSDTLRAIDRYLDPLSGGDDRHGWPFGGELRYQALVRRLLSEVTDLAAIASLSLTADGVNLGLCSDFATSRHALLWPGVHELTVEAADQ